MLTIQDIKEIIKMVDQSSIQKFQLEHETSKIVIEKKGLAAAEAGNTSAEPCRSGTPKDSAAESGGESVAAEGCKMAELHEVPSPMVGTFYAAPEPGAEPFVKMGQKVAADTVVCIIESMKLFNEVEAGAAGEVVEILCKDGDPVEYGQPLFVIKT